MRIARLFLCLALGLSWAVTPGCIAPFVPGPLSRGLALIEEGAAEEARAYIERAVASDPGSAALRNNLAVALEMAGEHEQACQEYKQAASLSPESACIRQNLGRCSMILGAKDVAGDIQWPAGKNEECRIVAIETVLPGPAWAAGFDRCVLVDFEEAGLIEGLDLGRELADYLARSINQLEGIKAERSPSSEAAGRLQPENRSVMIVRGSLNLTEQVLKAVLKSESSEGVLIKARQENFRKKKKLTITVQFTVLSAADGSVLSEKKIEETKQYDSAQYAASSALVDLFEAVEKRFLPEIAGTKATQERYVYLRQVGSR